MLLQKKSDIPSVRRLLLPLACVLGAAFLAASSARAAVTIGYDPFIDGSDGNVSDFMLKDSAVYVPFMFDFGSSYTLDSIQVPFVGNYANAGISLGITPTLGTNFSDPADFTPFSIAATSQFPGVATTFTFHPDSPTVFNSGVTYYLRMAYVGAGELQWLSRLSDSGNSPAESNPPSSAGPPPGGGPSPGGTDVTLTPLMALNAGGFLTFRHAYDNSYTDEKGPYQLSITAHAVPEPTSFAMIVGGLTLGAALLFRLRRRN